MVERVVLHPARPPGVQDAVLDLAGRGLIELVDATSDDEVAVALEVPGSVLVSHRWRPDFLTGGLAWVQCLGVGVDQFPLDELAMRGIPLCNARGVAAGCVAEHAFALLLAMTRRLPEFLADQDARRWDPHVGVELSGLTVGVLGLGAVGREVARRGQAFGMAVLGLRRRPDPVPHVNEIVGLDELCARSDVLVVCLPGDTSTGGLVGVRQLAALQGGWLVNVGRGGIVDEPALLDALRSGGLRGAALDVVEDEPLAPSSPLWGAPHLLLTSHSAALSPRWGTEWAELFVANLAAARGEQEWASRLPASQPVAAGPELPDRP